MIWEVADHSTLDRLSKSWLGISTAKGNVLKRSVEARASSQRSIRIELLEQDNLVLLHGGKVPPFVLVGVFWSQFLLMIWKR